MAHQIKSYSNNLFETAFPQEWTTPKSLRPSRIKSKENVNNNSKNAVANKIYKGSKNTENTD